MRTGQSLRKRVAMVVILSFAAVASGAQEKEAISKIQRVTVYPNGATVERIAENLLPAGSSTLVVADIPEVVSADTLRIDSKSEGVYVVSYSLETPDDSAPVKGDAEQEKKIEILEQKKRELQDRIEALKLKQKTITTLAATWAQSYSAAGGKMPEGGPATWKQAWSALEQGMEEASADIRTSELAMSDLDGQIEFVSQTGQVDGISPRSAKRAIIRLSSAKAQLSTLSISYEIPNATWIASYEGRLDTNSGKIEIRQFAEVRQQSNEEWANVMLTLSTARHAAGLTPPIVSPWYLQAVRPQVETRKAGSSEMVITAAPPIMDIRKTEAGAMISDTMIASMGEFQLEYQIKERCSIQSSDQFQRYPLQRFTMPCALVAEVVPKVRPAAYLAGECQYTEGTILPSGRISLFLDGAFAGVYRLPLVRNGERFSLSFGEDDRIVISYHPEPANRSEHGMVKKEIEIERRTVTTVQNFHGSSIKIRLYDVLPTSQDEAIQVTLSPDTTPTTEKDFQGKKGVLLWEGEYAAKQKKEILFAFTVRFPAEIKVPGF